LARRAASGDKHAQFELGKRFRDGWGIPSDEEMARKLFRRAASRRGGTRLMHVPAIGSARLATVPVSSGPIEPGLAAAKAELDALDQRHKSALEARTSVSKGQQAVFDGTVGSVFKMVVKIEFFSDKCLVRGKAYKEPHEIYAEKAWDCLLTSRLPEDCTTYPDAILRSIRFVRYHDNFLALRRLMPRAIEVCLSEYSGSADSAYDDVKYAGMFDLYINDIGRATQRQKKLAAAFEEGAAVHSNAPQLPGYVFSQHMCRGLAHQRDIESADFWLLYCNTMNDALTLREGRVDELDKIMGERKLDGAR
jgi:hypothetical protein